MSVVFEEIIGTVEPPQPSIQTTPQQPRPTSERPAAERLRRELRLITIRRARLRAN